MKKNKERKKLKMRNKNEKQHMQNIKSKMAKER